MKAIIKRKDATTVTVRCDHAGTGRRITREFYVRTRYGGPVYELATDGPRPAHHYLADRGHRLIINHADDLLPAIRREWRRKRDGDRYAFTH